MVFSFTATGNSLYAATHFSDAPEFTARLAAEAGIRADYVSAIQMVDNYLAVFGMDEQDNSKALRQVPAKSILRKIRRQSALKSRFFTRFFTQRILRFLYHIRPRQNGKG